MSDSAELLPSILRARAFNRLNRFADALESVGSITSESLPHEYAGELLAVKASSYVGLGDACVEGVLTEARARAFSSGYVPVECEVEFTSAVAYWSMGDIPNMLTGITRLLELSEGPTSLYATNRSDYVYSARFWRSRGFDLRGLSCALDGDYAGQAAQIGLAFNEFDRANVDDAFVESRMLGNLAVLVKDLDSKPLADFVEKRAEQVSWSEFTADAEFRVFESIGWSRARRGDHLGAFRNLRRSGNCAPTIPLQILAILGRSFLARELGEVFTASEELEHAVRLSKQFDWASSGSESSVLFELARQIAPHDRKEARALWERYAALKSGVSQLSLTARGDRRQRADECSAHAAILVAEGQHKRAISLLLESFEIWSSVGYAWRAAAVAADLAELTGEQRYFDFVGREAGKQPNSWLARRFSKLHCPPLHEGQSAGA